MSSHGKGGKGPGKGGAKHHGKLLCKNLGIRKPAIQCLAQHGGIKPISSLFQRETGRVLQVFLMNMTQDTVTYTEYAKPKAVTAMVVYKLKPQGCTLGLWWLRVQDLPYLNIEKKSPFQGIP